MKIEAKRLEDGWHTVINGEVGGKISRSREDAMTHGDRVSRGLAKWVSLGEMKKSEVSALINRNRYFGRDRS